VPRVVVDVMLKPEILDPQGQALERIRELAETFLANTVIEDFTVRVEETAEAPA
jgi:phosphoribosylformylglycinamidine (FGAM) synthase PurS component